MATREILLLGNPLLYRQSEPVQKSELTGALDIGKDLHDTMMDFRIRRGWGRAIAAPQIGVFKRIVYLHVDKPWLLLNPTIGTASPEMMELWDDCMSFPDLLVRVQRHTAFTLRWRDSLWKHRTLRIEGALSELLQHEIDHLDGVLAVARAVDAAAFALQSQRSLLKAASFANSPAS
jgi:peptide deformylase